MTGTGSQGDPLIPETLTEFIAAVGTSGAYVKLTQDINAANDSEYTGELTSSIKLQCFEMDGCNHVIGGITVRDAYFFYRAQNSPCRIKNVIMRDMCHKKSGDSYTIFGPGGTYTEYDHVKLAIKVDVVAGTLDFGQCISLSYCAIAIEYTSPGSFYHGIFASCGLSNSTIYIKNVTSSNIILQYSNWYTRNAFILDALHGSLTLTSRSSRPKSLNYYAIIKYADDIVIDCGDSGATNLVATDNESIEITVPSGWTRCSINQLKDKNYLSSVGWLP